MIKKFIFAGLVAVLGVAGSASAADITNIEFSNGDTSIQCRGGQTVNAEVRIVVPSGEVVEYIQRNVSGDGLAPKDDSVGGTKGLEENTHFENVSFKCPPNTGWYDVEVQTAGIYGPMRSINGDDGVNGFETFSDAIRVTANGSSGSVGGGEVSLEMQLLMDLIDDLKAENKKLQERLDQILAGNTGGTPAPTACPIRDNYGHFSTKYVQGGNVSFYDAMVTNAQVAMGMQLGSEFGWWGPKTQTQYNNSVALCR